MTIEHEIRTSHGGLPALHVRDDKNTPYNKRPGQVAKSTLLLDVTDYNGDQLVRPEGWTEIRLEEITQSKAGGPFQTRTISVILHGDQRQALIDLLNGASEMSAPSAR